MQKVIEDGYRKARKHSGSFSVVTQSVNDLELFGRVGKVIFANSSFKFFLQADDIEKARSTGILDYGDFELALLKSVKQNRPRYSEIFMDTPFGKGVARLAVDPFSYYIYTSAPDDNKRIETVMQQKGISYEKAIKEILGSNGKNGNAQQMTALEQIKNTLGNNGDHRDMHPTTMIDKIRESLGRYGEIS
jgi:conjugal transfer ATP-binding protein TraC